MVNSASSHLHKQRFINIFKMDINNSLTSSEAKRILGLLSTFIANDDVKSFEEFIKFSKDKDSCKQIKTTLIYRCKLQIYFNRKGHFLNVLDNCDLLYDSFGTNLPFNIIIPAFEKKLKGCKDRQMNTLDIIIKKKLPTDILKHIYTFL
jgi:hypothetical protein